MMVMMVMMVVVKMMMRFECQDISVQDSESVLSREEECEASTLQHLQARL